ncbi:CDP-alcohol phosphatidyltransferase-domain-containing protein [Mycotypha africana]|uniref:CDP-alcohol phosphatidyltransferase-domain-containing protein n=1 Tax=Mycotypha africana TaxID=64632 RepID=UPI0023019783|nr:CDP-alcohol phosphatidyltransferase-domain-containing protein [Mycotypha africana]KAI8975620.1 CDP-alcohol phosphatidyltransferase-domain-containing protein [Mycotypha africana]
MITLLGLLTVVVNVITLFYYAPDLGECPNWVYTSFGICLFVYQSLDAIDGKQARRTQTSGPLGELFDHGCDALNTTLGCLTWASSVHLGQSWWTVASLLASLGNFYLSTWEEYHTGILFLGYFSGPVEGVIVLCCIHLISGFFGSSFWLLRVDELLNFIDFSSSNYSFMKLISALQLNHVIIIFAGVVLILNIVVGFFNVIMVKFYPTENALEDRSISKAMLGLFPFVNMCFWSYKWMQLWPDIVTEHLSLFILFLGLLFGHQVGLMITAHVAKMKFPYVNVPVNLILLSGCLIAYFEDKLQLFVAVDHRFIVKIYLLIATFQYYDLASSVIEEICTYLDIGCLYIKKKATPTPAVQKINPKF